MLKFEIICRQPDESEWKVTGWEQKEEIAKFEMRAQARRFPDVIWAIRNRKTGEITQ